MKYKSLTKNQIIISIDRLTRFKPPEEKYLRVFKDIIVSNLIEPRLKKAELEALDYQKIRDIAVEIFNSSFEKNNIFDLSINCRLRDYEKSIFNINEKVDVLLENKLDYISAISLLDEYKTDIPINLLWLKSLKEKVNIENLRKEKGLLYPISSVVIVEGITEDILLPKFSKILGVDFEKYGIKVLPAGGKNQVVKLYYSMIEELKIPIFVLLDRDAVENVSLINKRLRNCDEVYLLNSGEFEDLLPKELIVKTINSHLKNFATIDVDYITKEEPMVKILEEVYKVMGIHEFKKAEFANLVKSQLSSIEDVSDEIKCIISDIKKISINSVKSCDTRFN